MLKIFLIIIICLLAIFQFVASGLSESPRVGGLSDSPRVGGLSDSPRVGGLSESPRVGGLSESPRAGGLSDSPRVGGRKHKTDKSSPPANTKKSFCELPRYPQGEIKDLREYPRSRNETRAIAILEDIVGEKFPACNPPWLVFRGRTLELDGFNGQIAFEFSGPLHTKWFPKQETYAQYFTRLQKDRFKAARCAELGIPFITLDITMPARHWRAYIESRLHDYGLLERPARYIEKQVVEPYRNKQIEEEENLVFDDE